MRTPLKLASALLLLATLNPQLSTAFAQGTLTPPGAPAPTMLTLSQIEPRIPISSAPFVIRQPGAYYLTTNITVSVGDAIDIATNGVTLDLKGFTISSTLSPANGTAIALINGVSDITILNGHIVSGVTNNGGVYSGNGFGYGVTGLGASNERVVGVSVSGCQNDGIGLGGLQSVVESCTVQIVGGYGISANTISRSTAVQCGNAAIYAGDTASDCTGYSTGSIGVSAGTVENCFGNSSVVNGVEAEAANNSYGVSGGAGAGVFTTVANNCFAESVHGDGVQTYIANNCFGTSSTGSGIVTTTANNCYGNGGDGAGIAAQEMVIGCYGVSNTGLGLSAFIAESSYGKNSGGLSESVTYKLNMP